MYVWVGVNVWVDVVVIICGQDTYISKTIIIKNSKGPKTVLKNLQQ